MSMSHISNYPYFSTNKLDRLKEYIPRIVVTKVTAKPKQKIAIIAKKPYINQNTIIIVTYG
jgi:hypothetical protein